MGSAVVGLRPANVGNVFSSGFGLARIEKFAKGSDGRDKFAKGVAAAAELAKEISLAVNGKGHKITREAGKVEGFAHTARDVTGLLNIFGGVLSTIRSIVFTVLPNLFKNLDSNDVVYLRGAPKPGKGPTHEQRLNSASDPFQKRLAIVESLAGLISALAYTIGFGVCRVIRLAGKVTGELGVGAKRMVNGFAPIMFINHVGGLVSNGAALWRTHKIVSGITDLSTVVDENQKPDSQGFLNQYAKQTVASVLDIGEKVAEIVCDAAKFGAPIPPIAKAALGMLIAGLGITKVFTNTYEVPKAA